MNKYGKRMSDEDKIKAIALYSEGKSALSIEKELGFTNVTISRYLRSVGLDTIPTSKFTSRSFTKEEILDFQQKYYDGMTLKEIGKLYQAHEDTISMHLKKIGVKVGIRTFTEPEISRIKELYIEKKYTIENIGKEMCISPSIISEILRESGFELGRSKKRISSVGEKVKSYSKVPRTREKLTGVTVEQYDSIFLNQKGRCAICGMSQEENGRRLAADHDHVKGEFRGILCNKCNSGLGMLGDSLEGLQKAIAYLTSDVQPE